MRQQDLPAAVDHERSSELPKARSFRSHPLEVSFHERERSLREDLGADEVEGGGSAQLHRPVGRALLVDQHRERRRRVPHVLDQLALLDQRLLGRADLRRQLRLALQGGPRERVVARQRSALEDARPRDLACQLGAENTIVGLLLDAVKRANGARDITEDALKETESVI